MGDAAAVCDEDSDDDGSDEEIDESLVRSFSHVLYCTLTMLYLI